MCIKKQCALPDILSPGYLAARDQRFQHLLNEEGVPLSQLVDAFYQAGMHYLVSAKDALEHCIDIGPVEALQGEVLGQVCPVKFGQAVPQLWGYFIMAVGQHKQHRQMDTLPRQVHQQFKTGVVAPVEMFNDEQQGLVCAG